jgi:hypothetical protein
MKKILTLLIAAGAFVSLHAQSREETRRVILGGNKDNGTYGGRDVILGGGNNGQYPSYPNNGGYSNDRQYQIDQVNREYDTKIQSIRNNPYLSNQEKDRSIRQLENDRRRRIDDINRSYNGNYGRYDNDNRYQKDNGKHKGWYKKDKNKNWKKGKNNRDWEDD